MWMMKVMRKQRADMGRGREKRLVHKGGNVEAIPAKTALLVLCDSCSCLPLSISLAHPVEDQDIQGLGQRIITKVHSIT